jgi:tetratricopeptide (TPR) repeat protein
MRACAKCTKGEPKPSRIGRTTSAISQSYDRIGDIYRVLGQGEKAGEAYQNSLQIREQLAEAEPDRADYQRDLSISYNKVGDLYYDLGQGEKAREAYLKAQAIAERLAEAEPDRVDYQVDLAIFLNRVGISGDSVAREPIERALAILLALQEAGRLAPERESMIPMLREMLDKE